MPTIEEVDTKVEDLKKSVVSLQVFDGFVKGVATMLAVVITVVFSVLGFWIYDSFNKLTILLDDATERAELLDQDIDRLNGELAKLDTSLSRRFQQVEQSVVDITSQPLVSKPPRSENDETLGDISTPGPGSTVGTEFQARGTVRLGPNQVAWVAVRIGRLYWPKEPPIEASGPWNRRVYEGGVPGRKWLALLVVERDVNAEIEQWFETARQTGSYPGMRLDRRAIAVAEVEFTLR